MSDDFNGGNRGTGEFKLNIDERDLATGDFDPVRQQNMRTAYRDDGYNGSYNRDYISEEERKAENRAHKKRNRVKARKNKWIFAVVWICMVVLLGLTLASYLIGGANDFFAVKRGVAKVEVELPENVTPESLAELLYKKGAINKKEFFRLYSNLTVDDWSYFEPGVYEISMNMDYEDLLNTLQGGNDSREVVKITFTEGMTALEMAALLEENEVCTSDEFLTALNDDFSNYEYISDIADSTGKYYRLEGYLFPDTYEFWKGEEIRSVVGKMLYNFQERLSDTTVNLILQSGFTMDEIITMASIIQREAADESDMYLVSAVLHNRLSYGAEYGVYWLQCDSTCFYPYKTRLDVPDYDALPHGAYDTYQIQGLPAGAICNPSLDAINAALKPSTEGDAPNYLYFCHDSDGNAYYATNEDDHMYNRQIAGLD